MNKKSEIIWGEDPELFGPKDWFRNSLLIQELTFRVNNGHILDYGCGTGICLRRLIEKGFHVTGIDLSLPNISYLKNKLLKNQNVILLHGDNSLLKKSIILYDAIICGETLEHLKDDVMLVKTFHRVLKPNGYVILSVPAHQELWTDVDVYAGHYRRYSKKGLQEVFTQNGFTIEKIFYWGFPLGTLWDKYVSLPLIRKKMLHHTVYTNSSSVLGSLMKYPFIKKILAFVFYFDTLFFFNINKGNGLILIAKKNI